MTDAEAALWSELRGRRFAGLKFRRQRPIGPYIVDFVCYKPKLVIELDGGQHNEKHLAENDAVRTDWLNARGFKVLRFWDDDALQRMESVLQMILLEVTLLTAGDS